MHPGVSSPHTRCTFSAAAPLTLPPSLPRWRQRKAVQGVSLFLVDEMHLLGGPVGPVIEVCETLCASSIQLMCSHVYHMCTAPPPSGVHLSHALHQ